MGLAWAKYFFAVATLLLCIVFLSCGGSSNPKPLVITITPSPATIAVNASVRMSFDTNPELPPYTRSVTWAIQEYQSSTRCTEERLDSNESHPIPDCPYGWLEITPPIYREAPSVAYYYSPEAAGTWHVTVDASIYDGAAQRVSYKGNSSAVVTVTNP